MSSFPASNQIVSIIFIICLATTGIGALIAIMSSRIIRSVCGLAICCIGLAGLYYFLHSPFLALMEILIYVGAVCVTIVFAIMLSEPEEPASSETRSSAIVWGGVSLAVAAGIFWGLRELARQQVWSSAGERVNDGSIKAIGISLLTTYSLAFEAISVALLVAILGALAIARGTRSNTQK